MRTVFAAPLAIALVLAGCAHGGGTTMGRTKDAPPGISATTQLLGPSGELRGTATLTQMVSATQVRARVEGLRPGTYAIHIHSVGRCEGPKFTSAGDHFNPTMTKHGKDNPLGPHLGDLPNVIVGTSGSGTVDYTVVGLLLIGGTAPLLDADGAAIIVNAGPDDYKTDPSGNSGDRLACGSLAAR